MLHDDLIYLRPKGSITIILKPEDLDLQKKFEECFFRSKYVDGIYLVKASFMSADYRFKKRGPFLVSVKKYLPRIEFIELTDQDIFSLEGICSVANQRTMTNLTEKQWRLVLYLYECSLRAEWDKMTTQAVRTFMGLKGRSGHIGPAEELVKKGVIIKKNVAHSGCMMVYVLNDWAQVCVYRKK